jgi:hypothetical protein
MRFDSKAACLTATVVFASACGGDDIGLGSTNPDASREASIVVDDAGGPPGDGLDSGNDDATVDATTNDATVDAMAADATSAPDAQDARSDASEITGGGSVDAGYYYGDGSFFTEGGPYSGPSDAGAGHDAADGSRDAEAVDASTGCGALSACCGSLATSLQPLCSSIAGAGNEANCATELAQLEGDDNCTGVTVLASNIQVAPQIIVSDGTTLFWTTSDTPGLAATPVHRGPTTVLLAGPLDTTGVGQTGFLAVDSVNVYVLDDGSVIRIPKNGAPPTQVNQSGTQVRAATALGATIYWTAGGTTLYAASPLAGPAITPIAQAPTLDGYGPLGMTTGAIFMDGARYPLGTPGSPVTRFSLSPSATCGHITSDTDAVYCSTPAGSDNQGLPITRVATDGTVTQVGPSLTPSYVVVDDTYAYWADDVAVGTIMKAPKSGGGTATVIARDTNPNAIAVDATSVYWGDAAGHIKSVPK